MSGSPIDAFVSFQPFRMAAVTSGAVGQLVPAGAGHSSRHLQGKTAIDSNCSCSVFFFWKTSSRYSAQIMTGLSHKAAVAALGCS